MTLSEEKKQARSRTRGGNKADGNIGMPETGCSVMQEWFPDGEDFPADGSGNYGLPPTGKIKEKIIRRVYQIIDECNDPKKLMDAYEAMTKLEERIGPKESIFDVVERNLREETSG